MAKKKALIGAQMWTVREFCATPADIAKACARIKAMGYDGIQSSGGGPIDPQELKRILDGEGLACAATHVSIDAMLNETQRVIDEHRLWNCAYTAIGGFFPKADDWRPEVWDEFVAKFNQVAAKFQGSGISVGYHNHSHELAPFKDGRTPIQMLFEKLDPSLWFEIDTYWITHGGGDPCDWIEKATGRIPCVHFKDMTITPARQQKMCEVGGGNLNWPRIIKTCKKAGAQWYLVERDAGDMDAFDCLKVSLDNLRNKFGL
ncbi:MAG: hypothetical protein A3K19_21525 [Lentisphaerae bacterium RIFOXYB12_FULL_65_16]|nr:MAG: hypothetical protein A3K18_20775 [Lentisphaerae bacterium RIFOXYA12_64_32]OGV93849.1 MAG: hypothetical protein A3K19_21525 [Lentisphaerae bacterium RIFOXYB12_FULL_65_16]